MNVKNNKRKKESIKKIEKVFIELLQVKELNTIKVSDICKIANLNRSTFYANYVDIYELANTIRKKLESNLGELYQDEITKGYNSNNFLKLFHHIKENQLLYQTYFKLGYDRNYKIMTYDKNLAKKYFDNKYIEYHMEFFRGGFTTIVKVWLENECKETPEEMNEVIISEYNRHKI